MLVIDGTFGQMIGNNIHYLNNERMFNLLTNNGLYNLSINRFDSCLLSVLGIEQNILRCLTGRLGTSLHCLVVTCWERADLLALDGDVYCIFVTFPCNDVASCVRFCTGSYCFLIFAIFLPL